MGVLRNLFGPSKDEIWRQLSAELGGQFITGSWGKGSKVQVREKEWTLTLDTYVVSTGKSSVTYTRMRAPYVNADDFRFTIYRKGVFSEIGKMLGMQDVEVGHEQFDHDFIIKGTSEAKLRALFANRQIRDLINVQDKIHIEVKDNEGYFGPEFPEGADELYFQVIGVIKDPERLKRLYELFAAILNHLCHIGSAYKNDPHVLLK